MKNTRVFWLATLLVAALSASYLYSCKQETDSPEPTKVLTDQIAIDRACSNGCECKITATTDCWLTVCGNIEPTGTNCTACGVSNLAGGRIQLEAGVTRTICMNNGVNICLTNDLNPSALDPIIFDIQFGGSQVLEDQEIYPDETRCFHSVDFCTATEPGCI